MLTVDEALGRVLAQVTALPAEAVGLADAYGRILAENLVATLDVPGWDNSAMDGYAVCAADTAGGAVSLRLLEVIAAGAVPQHEVVPGTCSAIMTGAMMPAGADAVVMVENSDGSQEGSVRIRGGATVGQHIRRRGEDITTGSLLLPVGRRLGAADVGLAASQGVPTLLCSRRPVVAVLITGDEVVPPGQPLDRGQIYSSNNASLCGLIHEAGGIPLDAGIASDDLDSIVTRLSFCIQEADIVLTTGGVSVGEFDFVKAAFQSLGIPMDFWKVAMKPGKPLAFGLAEGPGGQSVPIFGLPGNPVSCFVNFYEFVRPWMLRAMGCDRPHLPVLTAIAAQDIHARVGGRAQLLRVVLEQGEAGWQFRSTGSQSSGVLTSLVRANGLLLLAPGQKAPKAGEAGRVQLTDASFLDREEPGYGW